MNKYDEEITEIYLHECRENLRKALRGEITEAEPTNDEALLGTRLEVSTNAHADGDYSQRTHDVGLNVNEITDYNCFDSVMEYPTPGDDIFVDNIAEKRCGMLECNDDEKQNVRKELYSPSDKPEMSLSRKQLAEALRNGVEIKISSSGNVDYSEKENSQYSIAIPQGILA